MHYIRSVIIDGFWGSKRVEIKFHRDLNFLIGPNGSGKTTIINLISAALRADIPTLYSIPFEKIQIKLRTIGSNRTPSIDIVKSVDELMGNIELIYHIREKSSEPASTYGVEGPYDERLYRDARTLRVRRMHESGARLSSILGALIEVNWLSVHRTSLGTAPRGPREEGLETTIDQKIKDITKNFATYFSLLSSRAAIESKNFQESIFLSLLDQERSHAGVTSQASAEPENKLTVIGVLKSLGVADQRATKSVNAHYSRLEEAQRRYNKDNSLSVVGAVTLADAQRVRQMIQKWRELNQKRDVIFAPKNQYEEIINGLYSGKRLYFDERNIPKINLSSSNDPVDISALSSGEKQLFILLGEALLQEQRPVVFISDEPELSLHVRWQSMLFESIRKLNNQSQIISATHSPDIVGVFQDKTIHIESCIRNV